MADIVGADGMIYVCHFLWGMLFYIGLKQNSSYVSVYAINENISKQGVVIKDLIIGFLRRFEMNRAVLFSILSQVWVGLAGLISILVIAHWLSAEQQGFYYTFNSILALQVFVELGLTTVIVQTASHEWAFLRRETNGKISGQAEALSRLASLGKFSLKWYGIAGLIAMIALSIVGIYFFSMSPHTVSEWRAPWAILCIVAGLSLMMSPIFSLIEGCNQVASVYFYRLLSGIFSSIAVWGSIFLGYGLYAIGIAAAVRFVSGIIFVFWKHRLFIRQILTTQIRERIEWRRELWPFQWRIALSWLSGYFIFAIFNPVMFHYHGAAVAGQMGMTLALVTTPYNFSIPWINSRFPQFGILIAHRQYGELDAQFGRLFKITLIINIALSGGILILAYGLQISGLSFKNRILPLLPFTLLGLGWIVQTAVFSMATYLRAHKREPLMMLSIIGAVLTGCSTWLLGSYYGPLGAAAGFFVIATFIGLPFCYYVFVKFKRNWHNQHPMCVID